MNKFAYIKYYTYLYPMSQKRISTEEYNILKSIGYAAIITESFAVGKNYSVLPPKDYVCNGVEPLDGEYLAVRCTQNMPLVLKTQKHLEEYK